MKRRLIALIALIPAVSLAQDTDSDGVLDETDNCVTVSNADQSVSQSAPYDFLGDACVPASVVLAPNVNLDTTVRLGAGTVVARQSTLINNASTGEDCTLDRAVSMDGASVGDDSSIGYGTTIDTETQSGERLTAGALVTIGKHVTLGDDVVLARGVVIEDWASIASGTVVGPNVTIGRGAVIESGVRIRKDTSIGAQALVRSGARVGRDVTIGDGADVGTDSNIGARAEIGEFDIIDPNEVIARATTTPVGDCSDTIDPDGDGLFGCADPDCFGDRCPELCDDGEDNDADGHVDAADTDDCESAGPEECDNGEDDNGNALVDCADPECFGHATCDEVACDNGEDDDNDGFTDCEDEDCWGLDCHPGGTVATITGGEGRAQFAQTSYYVTTSYSCSNTGGYLAQPHRPRTNLAFNIGMVYGNVRVDTDSGSVEVCDWQYSQATFGGAVDNVVPVQRQGFQFTGPSNCRLAGSSFLPQRLYVYSSDRVNTARTDVNPGYTYGSSSGYINRNNWFVINSTDSATRSSSNIGYSPAVQLQWTVDSCTLGVIKTQRQMQAYDFVMPNYYGSGSNTYTAYPEP